MTSKYLKSIVHPYGNFIFIIIKLTKLNKDNKNNEFTQILFLLLLFFMDFTIPIIVIAIKIILIQKEMVYNIWNIKLFPHWYSPNKEHFIK